MNWGSLAVHVIIPALNEEKAIGRVIADIPRGVQQVWVVDNGSSDRTAEVAAAAGANVLHQPERGYGAACLLGIDAALAAGAQTLVFLDGDYSDFPGQITDLLQPLATESADLVIGSRELGHRAAGSLMPQQRFGNWLATNLMRWIYGVHYTDLGPFRAISRSAYEQLGMRDRNYGWTVEMQIRAAQRGLRGIEVPVDYRPRIGTSKVSGTLKGTVLAGYKILSTLFILQFRHG
jgi:glycosyltransferase involved in cell wall biosynthesis